MAIKEYSIDTLIAEFEAARDLRRRRRCPITDHLKEMRAAGADFNAAQQYLMLEAGPAFCIEIMLEADIANTGAALEEVQERWANAVVMYGWDKTRVLIERLFHKSLDRLTPGAVAVFVAEIEAEHPNAAGFLAQFPDKLPSWALKA